LRSFVKKHEIPRHLKILHFREKAKGIVISTLLAIFWQNLRCCALALHPRKEGTAFSSTAFGFSLQLRAFELRCCVVWQQYLTKDTKMCLCHFVVKIDFGSSPTPSSPFPVGKLYQRHTGILRKRDNLLTGKAGAKGWARSQVIRPQESLALYKLHNTFWDTLSQDSYRSSGSPKF
jgi:hypothetical protein